MKVFVTVGTTKFDALIDLFDDEQFVNRLTYITQLTIQYGHSHEPRYHAIPLTAFSLTNKFAEYVANSDLVISTASAGVRLDVLAARKPHLMLANRELHGDHQREMVLANEGKATVRGFLSVSELRDFLLDFGPEKLAQMALPPVSEADGAVREIVEETLKQKRGNQLWVVFSALVVALYAAVQANKWVNQ